MYCSVSSAVILYRIDTRLNFCNHFFYLMSYFIINCPLNADLFMENMERNDPFAPYNIVKLDLVISI